MSPDAAAVDGFRSAMRRLASGVSILTAHADGRDFAMTATAVCSLSATPPRLIVCVNRSASIHDPIAAGGRFGVNIMAAADERLVRACAGGAAPGDRFDDQAWVRAPGEPPRCRRALAFLACEVLSAQSFESHSVFIASVAESCVTAGGDALVYLNGQFASLAAAPFETGRLP